ncbi:MAG: VWA domain-containing protein [Gemmatimonadales bacterium]|jgi:Ca-activated chloride channel homolog|nr:VWA domain-containing protein [Gemmatimonadales bacterium]MBT3773339.1 VWA domain-containing protein [Gemmatimonadales bacterium]MBT3959219.1 VWA domain-containing protein [Gemmatimonadales bacterium]MBT4435935.1 VWA domain-containing protein [Gemmatimonadales bacterium]MBT4914866.1 VWA domain-containing protein [Gemmatimonadales bacterium]
MKTSILLDHEPVADGGFLVRALLSIEGEEVEDDRRTPLNLSLVLDRSGSMHGEKLAAARDAAVNLVKRLSLSDVVSVVAYDDEVEVVAAPDTGRAQSDLTQKIQAIGSRGMTNLSGGWLRGRDLVAQGAKEGAVNRVILLTDGHANVGITEPGKLVGLTQTAAGTGISTTTVGFGADFDEDLLKAMADAGQGATYYIEEADQAVGIFEEELEGLLSLVAQNVRVTINPGADADFVQVVHQYPNHTEGEALTLEVGDLYGREPRRIIMEFLLGPEAGIGTDADVATLSVVANVLTADGGVELHNISLPITLSPEEGGKAEPEVQREALLVEVARARQQALDARDAGDWERGHQILTQASAKAQAMGFDDLVVQEEMADLAMSAESFEDRSLSLRDIKYMKQRMYSADRSKRREIELYRRGE